MKSTLKYLERIFWLLILLLGLSGCGVLEELDLELPFLPEKEKTDLFEPSSSALYVREDGSVVSVEREDFGEEVPDGEELRLFLSGYVEAYNAEAHQLLTEAGGNFSGADVNPVSLVSVTKEGTEAVVRMEYWSAADYLEFQQDYDPPVIGLSLQTVGEAVENGNSFPGSFKTRNGDAAKASDFQKKEKWFVLTVTADPGNEAAYPVQVQGEIRYVSVNAAQVTEDTARIPAGETVTIIFK